VQIDKDAMNKNLLWLLVLLSLMGGYAYAQDSSEAAKIRYLIGSVEASQGVTFLRNGGEYDATKAADHLRLKFKMAGNGRRLHQVVRFEIVRIRRGIPDAVS
jgi:hypothetical protein